MSDLWMILVLLGVSIVLGVVLFNWWQEKKYRRDVEYRFGQSRSDVLEGTAGEGKRAADKSGLSEDMEGWMSEPRVRGASTNTSPAAKVTSAKIEPSFSIGAANIGEPALDDANSPAPSVSAATVKTQSSSPVSVKSVPEKTLDKAALQKLAGELQAVQQDTFVAKSPVAQQASATPIVPAANQQALDFAEMAAPITAAATPAAYTPDTLTLDDSTPATTDDSLLTHRRVPVTLPGELHTAMDWVGLIEAPLGVMLAELEDMLAEVRTFPQHTALWVQCEPGVWENLLEMDKASIQTHGPAQRLACALQLADRGGPVDAETLKRFQKSMETLARGLGLQVVWQGDYQVEQQAHAIDAFAIEVDKAVEFHLMAGQGMFHATKLRGLAEASGMHLSEQGRFELVNAHGQLSFTLRNFEGKAFSAEMLKTAVMTGVTFQLDIPTTPNSVQVFDQMVEVARTMAHSLNATMTDVNRKPIGDTQLDKIRQQLKTISATMAEQGILPGSSHALRLFS